MKFNPGQLETAAQEELLSAQDNAYVAIQALDESQLRSLVLHFSHYYLANELLGKEGKIPSEAEMTTLDAMNKLQETVMGTLQLTNEGLDNE